MSKEATVDAAFNKAGARMSRKMSFMRRSRDVVTMTNVEQVIISFTEPTQDKVAYRALAVCTAATQLPPTRSVCTHRRWRRAELIFIDPPYDNIECLTLGSAGH